MKDYIKFIDNLPFIVKLIFALPGIDGIIYGIYRIAKGRLILGIIWIFVGAAILWIIDLYSVIRYGKIKYFA
jgi:hypothetical protein